jgi:beta-lactam-binding protein with PASTA domain
MSAGTIILIVVILVIVAVATAVMSTRMRRRVAERNLVGPEYDRLVDEVGPRKARAEFEKRRQRVDGLGIKSLTPERRSAYAGQ